MKFDDIFQRFTEKSPVAVSVHILLERIFSPDKLNQWFEKTAVNQYTRELSFSSIFELMNGVVFKMFPCVFNAYQSADETIGVSVTSVYNKLNGLEASTSATLVHDTAQEMTEIIEALGGPCKPWLPGYRVKVLDGNCIEATEHRLQVLQNTKAGPLPGKSLNVYDPALEMVIDVFPCEDGHTQEWALLGTVLSTVQARDIWIMDRNFCVRDFLSGIVDRGGFLICRQHASMPWTALGDERYVGNTETGKIYEQWIEVTDTAGRVRKYRRIRVCLNTATRDGEHEICVLTNLPKSVADGRLIAEMYRKRWTIETAFQELEAHLHSEINTLGYPKAALFGFCIALVAYNLLAVVKAALRAVHGEETIENDVSSYYLAGHIGRTHEGMMIALPSEYWVGFQSLPLTELVEVLLQLAHHVKLSQFKKHRRGPKKPPPKRDQFPKQPHVSTARLLAAKKKKKMAP